MDSGVDSDHPYLSEKVIAERDFVEGDATADDEIGHGTQVAGIAASNCSNCSLIAAKVAGPGGMSPSTIANGIVWSANNGADVINLSLGGSENSAEIQQAVSYAESRGSTVVAAVGNSGTAEANYPASYGGVIGVGATDGDGEHASYSNVGPAVDFVAPGSWAVSNYPDDGYGIEYGTSFAAPYVSGVAGSLASQGLPADRIEGEMASTARDLGPAGKDYYYGHGFVGSGA